MTDAEASADQELVDADRRKFLTAATSATAGVGVVFPASPFIASWQPSERARPLGAPVTVDLSKLQAGQMIMPGWRRQATYVLRRPPELVAQLRAHDPRPNDPNSLA